MNNFKPSIKPRFKIIPMAMQAYSARSFLFLTLLLPVAAYEMILNSTTHKEALPLFAIIVSVIIN